MDQTQKGVLRCYCAFIVRHFLPLCRCFLCIPFCGRKCAWKKLSINIVIEHSFFLGARVPTNLFMPWGLLCFCFLHILGPLACGPRIGSATEPCARCDSKIVYTVTNQEAAEYNCPAPGNESGAEKGTNLGTKPGMAQKGSVLQFTGRLCGYDSWFELAALFSELEFDFRRNKKVLINNDDCM